MRKVQNELVVERGIFIDNTCAESGSGLFVANTAISAFIKSSYFLRCNSTGEKVFGSCLSLSVKKAFMRANCYSHSFSAFHGSALFSTTSEENEAEMETAFQCPPSFEGLYDAIWLDHGLSNAGFINASFCTPSIWAILCPYSDTSDVLCQFNTLAFNTTPIPQCLAQYTSPAKNKIQSSNFVNNSVGESTAYSRAFLYINHGSVTFNKTILIGNNFTNPVHSEQGGSVDWSGTFLCENSFDSGINGTRECTETNLIEHAKCAFESSGFTTISLAARRKALLILFVFGLSD